LAKVFLEKSSISNQFNPDS